jgi:hypothetical protein
VIVLGCYTVTFNGNLAQEREVILSQKKEKEKKKGKRKKKKIELGDGLNFVLNSLPL